MNEELSTVRLSYGDVEALQVPQEMIDSIFGPFSGSSQVSTKDFRFRYDRTSDEYHFEGDEADWRILLLEYSVTQYIGESHSKILNELIHIRDQVNRLRSDLSILLDPQRREVSRDVATKPE